MENSNKSVKAFVYVFFAIVLLIIGVTVWSWNYDFNKPRGSKPKEMKEEESIRKMNVNDPSFDMQYGTFVQYKTYYTFNETHLLKDTNLHGEVIAELAINAPVQILDALEKEEEIDGMRFRWYKVKYKNKKGYLVSNDIAFSNLKLPNDRGVKSVALINISAYRSGLEMKVKLIEDNVEVSASTFKSFTNDDEGYFGYDVTSKLIEKPLTGVKKLIELEMGYGACGYYGGAYYIFWDGEKLYDGIAEAGVADAGVMSEYTDLIFPDESGKKDTIIAQYAYYEYGYNEKDSTDMIADSSKSTKLYIWKEKEGLEEADGLF